MKYVFLVTFAMLLFNSCSQEIEDNSTTFQGVNGTTFFKAFNTSAVLNPNGGVTVRGATDTEEVRLRLSSLNQSTVVLGADGVAGNSATYTNEFGTVFSTNNENGSGALSLEVTSNNSISGTFNFVALTENATDTITFSKGFVFDIPILGVLDEGDGPTQEANTFTARVNTVLYAPTEITSSVSMGELLLAGRTGDRVMSLTMPENIAPGTYDISVTGIYTALYATPDGVFNAATGTLTILSNNTTEQRVTGDFDFDTAIGLVITNGSFSVSY